MKSVCVAVLNYNGVHHLQALLPSLLTARDACAIPVSVLVLDNQSSERDVEWIRACYPGVRRVVSPTNDYLFSYNWLLRQLDDDVVVLLNNDVRVRADFLPPLLRHLESPDVFAVSACSYDWSGTNITSGPARLSFRNGMYDWKFETSRQHVSHTLYTSGGYMAVDRQKFVELGGFNRLFYPAYCEDLDLCFRAWRRGWRSIYEPASVVWHRGEGSWSAVNDGRGSAVGLRSSFLFQWSSLPFHRQRWRRWVGTARRSVAHALRLDFRWSGMCVTAFVRWIFVRTSCRWMKVSEQELRSIEARIAERCA